MINSKRLPAPSGQVQSLVRALGLLDTLAEHGRPGLAMYELAARVQLPRSTTHRLLTTLEALNYAAYDRKTSLWSIGSQPARLASRWRGDVPLEVTGQIDPFAEAA